MVPTLISRIELRYSARRAYGTFDGKRTSSTGKMKLDTTKQSLAAFVAAIVLGSGCSWFLARPLNEGSVISPEGVKMTMIRQECAMNPDPVDPSDTGEIAVVLRVQNPTSSPVTIHRDTVRLLVPDFPAVPGAPTETGPLTAAGGGSETFEVRFKSPDELCCVDMDLHLDVAQTVTMDAAGGKPVALPPLMFGPSCDI